MIEPKIKPKSKGNKKDMSNSVIATNVFSYIPKK